MPDKAPTWLDPLQPINSPELEKLSKYSLQRAWHVAIDLTAWQVPDGRTLTGSDSWNGKALVVSTDSSLEYSVGEVEVTERLRSASRDSVAYWTAGWNTSSPPKRWHPWTLTREDLQREKWLLDLDRSIREVEPLLASNNRGRPDVISWRKGDRDLLCVEYKGPSPTKPSRVDEIRVEQDAWFRTAVQLGLIAPDRYVIAQWNPSASDRSALLRQSQARMPRKSSKDYSSGSAELNMQSPGGHGVTSKNEHGYAAPSKSRPPSKKDKLHRRTIRDTLKKTRGWDVKSHVAGTITIRIPSSASSLEEFREEVFQAVFALGYQPTVVLKRDNSGPYISVHTSETLDQYGRGGHSR